ncbi:hypothetical protein DICVIV_13719 [Dictyocaulus viviparus]|uniref:Cathepsin propeptide inhibitor domain protein n=1 Tax=Dictyocaulus viviparus TaxID=29172 RepID=A0A0D8X9M9_DICVI|nr:hypothetical protein DICVIV_13719 [Dictyocaulus viviparus]
MRVTVNFPSQKLPQVHHSIHHSDCLQTHYHFISKHQGDDFQRLGQNDENHYVPLIASYTLVEKHSRIIRQSATKNEARCSLIPPSKRWKDDDPIHTLYPVPPISLHLNIPLTFCIEIFISNIVSMNDNIEGTHSLPSIDCHSLFGAYGMRRTLLAAVFITTSFATVFTGGHTHSLLQKENLMYKWYPTEDSIYEDHKGNGNLKEYNENLERIFEELAKYENEQENKERLGKNFYNNVFKNIRRHFVDDYLID